MPMNRFVQFGPGGRLTGILAGPPAPSSRPILVLSSAGLQPRAGPFRLHVEIAERLASEGISTFRFDVPGVGEAPRLPRCDANSATLAAIDALAQLGFSNFVMGGLCSAADQSWNSAVQDPRVRAVLLLDGISFRGPWYHYAKTLDRVRRTPGQWRRMLRRVVGRIERGGGGDTALESDDFRDWPTHAQTRSQFASLVGRDVRMLWIYTGGYTDKFLHPRQFRWAFGTPAVDPRIAMHYWPDCDHLFYGRRYRDTLLDVLQRWMRELDQSWGARTCRQ